MEYQRITQSEIETIKEAQKGNELAFNKLFNRYKEFVDNVLFHYVNDMDEAKDLTNVVFLKVHQKLSTFTDYSSFGGWLRIIANRTAIDYLRKVKKYWQQRDELYLPRSMGLPRSMERLVQNRSE